MTSLGQVNWRTSRAERGDPGRSSRAEPPVIARRWRAERGEPIARGEAARGGEERRGGGETARAES